MRRRRRYPLIGLLLVACTGAPAPEGAPPLHAASVERHFDGSLARGLLRMPATIDGLPCRGWVTWHEGGRLESCELAMPTTIQGHLLPAASRVAFDTGGRLQTVFLACNTALQGHVCRGGPWQIATSFHPDGRLRTFVPLEPVTIDGVPCAATTQAPVHLHASGRLARARLAADAVVDGRQLRRGDSVQFDDRGNLEPARR